MLLLGLDIGTSSIKANITDAATGKTIASAQYPDHERPIKALKPGWAEQDPLQWWEDVQQAIKLGLTKVDANAVGAIGIAYQMHGLVAVDKAGNPLRHSIIWCDSRAVPYGDAALAAIGEQTCLHKLLNSPGNFTAAKLAWVKENEPALYEKIDKIMLPGDFIALKLTGEATTSASALSEGIFWDFTTGALSEEVFNYFGFDKSIIPPIKDVFTDHGQLLPEIATQLGLPAGIPVTYKAGDQPNNALSLNVLQPGEVAATAGTSGVIYAVTDQLNADKQSRVNSFAHVNHTAQQQRIGVLLCINGTGIANSFARNITGKSLTYPEMNNVATRVTPGSEGLNFLPFGNGAERMLGNKFTHAHLLGLDFNVHSQPHIFRAVQEGIAFSFRYGLDILRENGLAPSIIRAGNANLFLSQVFAQVFTDVTNTPVELHEGDGSKGAAIGAGIGVGAFSSAADAFTTQQPLKTTEPHQFQRYDELYLEWKAQLEKFL